MGDLTTTRTSNNRLRARVLMFIQESGPVAISRVVAACERYVPPEVAARYNRTLGNGSNPRQGKRSKILTVVRDLWRNGHVKKIEPHSRDDQSYVCIKIRTNDQVLR